MDAEKLVLPCRNVPDIEALLVSCGLAGPLDE